MTMENAWQCSTAFQNTTPHKTKCYIIRQLQKERNKIEHDFISPYIVNLTVLIVYLLCKKV